MTVKHENSDVIYVSVVLMVCLFYRQNQVSLRVPTSCLSLLSLHKEAFWRTPPENSISHTAMTIR